jgi:hypothetical protein
VLVFELLTGQRPFVRVPPWQRLNHTSPRLQAVAPHLPRGWDALVRRCLERKPEDRFARLDELMAALPDGEPAPAQVVQVRRLWLAVAAAVAVLAALAWKLF